MTIIQEFGSLPERIKASVERLGDLEAARAAELETRNRLLVEAVDQAGIPQAQVARFAGISQPHLIRILAASSD